MNQKGPFTAAFAVQLKFNALPLLPVPDHHPNILAVSVHLFPLSEEPDAIILTALHPHQVSCPLTAIIHPVLVAVPVLIPTT